VKAIEAEPESAALPFSMPAVVNAGVELPESAPCPANTPEVVNATVDVPEIAPPAGAPK
jgi:hypothetical protein